MSNRYEDILYLPRPISKKHPPMAMRDRAAQFAPFAALSGHEDAIRETARETSSMIHLDETEIAQLNRKLTAALEQHIPVQITYFVPDSRKDGGAYTVISGLILRVEPVTGKLLLASGDAIPVEDIVDVSLDT